MTWRSAPPPLGVAAHRVELTDTATTKELLGALRPDVVVHTAYSMTSRPDVVDASLSIASACSHIGAALIHLSSDLVFGGDRAPYGERDPADPLNDYGTWKAEAERLVIDALPDACITRTSLVVSLDPLDRISEGLLGAVAAGERPVLFDDEFRTPIRADDLAAQLWALVDVDRNRRSGVWHLPGPERLSRWEIGARVLRANGRDAALVRRGSVHEHPDPRPVDTTLISSRPLLGRPARTII